ncbi:hypothetical protein AB1Y20_009332 [Prymnesium parvum]|uniref:[Histone H3]-trimethyl-L-lysine(9) demethylase n=1 Tax=Prymnesium parvum TaxID=97485 RepID=A0AB34K161_PRYPA
MATRASSSSQSRTAPTLHPSMEEFADFASYVRAIEPTLRHAGHGAALIVPPREWIQRLGDSRARLPASAVLHPIRQHVYGREKNFHASMEECAPMSVRRFERHALEHRAPGDRLSAAEMEAKFWHSIAGGAPALYGSDSSEVGSLFPRELRVWNLSKLPGGVENDLLQALHDPIPGLNQSMLYFGTWKSFFALHTEDCELQGASFLHFGAPKQWYVVPPTHAPHVRRLCKELQPELAAACDEFLRHKTTLIAPELLQRAKIPYSSVLQTEGTFVVVLSSAYHFGFNHAWNCAEAVNFALTNWLPVGRKARPCTCDGQQTPFIDVPLLHRRLRAAEPEATREWWCFVCACGEHMGVSQEDKEEDQPSGEMFECSGCQQWGHVGCYEEYAAAVAGGDPLPSRMFCVGCRDAWRDEQHAEEPWVFSCVCGRHEGASNLTAADGEAPSGRMFQCEGCSLWAHTECFERYRGQEDDALPTQMWCHRCDGRPRQGKPAGKQKGSPPKRVAQAVVKQQTAKQIRRAATGPAPKCMKHRSPASLKSARAGHTKHEQ